MIISLFTETSHKAKIVSLISSDSISVNEKKFYLAQTKLESGNFKRIKHNNFFGLKYKGRLMKFNSLADCYKYRKQLAIKHGSLYSKKYCPEKTYLKKIKNIMGEQWIVKINKQQNEDTLSNGEDDCKQVSDTIAIREPSTKVPRHSLYNVECKWGYSYIR